MLSTIALGLGIFNTIKYQYSPKEADRDEGVKQPRFVRPTSKTDDHAVTKFLYDSVIVSYVIGQKNGL